MTVLYSALGLECQGSSIADLFLFNVSKFVEHHGLVDDMRVLFFLQGREVQQRLVAQRQKAAARAFAAKATRNVSKARGKKAKATAAALAEW